MKAESESHFPELAAILAANENALAPDQQQRLSEELHLLDTLVHKALQDSQITLAKFYEQRILEMEANVREFGANSAQMTVENNRLRKQIQELQAALEKRLNENDEIYILHTKEVTQLQTIIAELKEERNGFEKANSEKRSEIDRLQLQIKELEQTSKGLLITIEELKITINSHTTTIDTLTINLEESRNYGLTLEQKLNFETHKYNDVLFLLSKKESEMKDCVNLIEEIKELRGSVQQLLVFIRAVCGEMTQAERDTFVAKYITVNNDVDTELLKKLMPFLFDDFVPKIEVHVADDDSTKPASYLKSLGAGEIEEGSLADTDPKDLVELNKEMHIQEANSLDGFDINRLKSPTIRRNEIERVSEKLLSKHDILDPHERQKYEAAAEKLREARLKRQETNGNQTPISHKLDLLQQQTQLLQQHRLQESEALSSNLNQSALSVLLNMMNTEDLHTSFFLSESQIRELLGQSSTPNALTEAVLVSLFSHIEYLERTIKAYISWSDIASGIIAEITKKSSLLKQLAFQELTSEAKVKKTSEIDELTKQAIAKRLDVIFKNRKECDKDFLKKVNAIAKMQANASLGDTYKIFKKSKFAVKDYH